METVASGSGPNDILYSQYKGKLLRVTHALFYSLMDYCNMLCVEPSLNPEASTEAKCSSAGSYVGPLKSYMDWSQCI